MEHYLRFRPLRGFMDALGVRLLLGLVSAAWFVYLWGLRWASVIAGLALAVLADMALHRGRLRRVARREDALRRRLGGEMALEDLLLCPEHQAHLRCASLLSMKYPLEKWQITEWGVIARQGSEKLLIRCAQIPPDAELPPDALLPAARAVLEAGAQRGVICATGRLSKAAEALSCQLPIPLRLVDSHTLIVLGGAASPATDAQLVALGQRRRRMPPRALSAVILHPAKARSYMTCGLMFAALYVITRLGWYPLPALVCLLLAAACRIRPPLPETL
ncbi:MAG: hypothetical protein IKK21_00020 [Clostridia bacterium]|nr:hypothetical protein [Clostridia bacterium]